MYPDYLERNQIQTAGAMPLVSKPINFRQEIQAKVEYFERELDKQRKLLALLDSNPAIEEFMNLTRS